MAWGVGEYIQTKLNIIVNLYELCILKKTNLIHLALSYPPRGALLTQRESVLCPLQLSDLVVHLAAQRNALALDDARVGRTHSKSLLLRPHCAVERMSQQHVSMYTITSLL